MSWLSRAVSAVAAPVKATVKAVDRAGGATLATIAKVPGASSALTVVTGGAAALNPRIRASATREFYTGAAAGGALGAVATLATPKAPAPSQNSPGDLEAIDRAAAEGPANLGLYIGGGSSSASGSSSSAARAPLLAGIIPPGTSPVVLLGAAGAVGLLVFLLVRRR